MIRGFNTDVDHRGAVFHVQTEAYPGEEPTLQSAIYRRGEILELIRRPYPEPEADGEFDEERVTERLTHQHRAVIAAIRTERLPCVQRVLEDLGSQIATRQVVEQLDQHVEQVEVARVPAPQRAFLPLAAAIAGLLMLGAVAWVILQPTPQPPSEPRPVAQVETEKTVELAEPVERTAPVEVVPSPETQKPQESERPPAPTVAQAPTPVEAEPLPEPEPEPVAVLSPPQPQEPAPEPAPEVIVRVEPEMPPIIETAPPVEMLPVETRPEPPPLPVIETGDLVELASVDRAPRATRRALPEYPTRARRKKQQGPVDLELLIDHAGEIQDVRVTREVEGSTLHETAIETARTWRYEPAHKAGVAVSVWLPVRVQFSIVARQTSVRVLEQP